MRQTSEANAGVSGAQELSAIMDFAFCQGLADFLAEDAQFTRVLVYNYTNSADYAERSSANAGTIESLCAPSQWCVGFKFNRPGIGWNYPRKRVSGFPAYVYANNDIDPDISNALDDVAATWLQPGNSNADFLWKVIRPADGFGLDNPVLTAERNVGTLLDIYDASQNTRRN